MHGGESSLRPRDVDDVISEGKRKKEMQILTLDNARNNIGRYVPDFEPLD